MSKVATRLGKSLVPAAQLAANVLVCVAPLVNSGCSPLAHRNLAPAVVANYRPLLNSERIERSFGSYGLEILYQRGSYRITDLYSGNADNRRTRTLALVEFALPLEPSAALLHKRILQGGSIGSTFKSAGWDVSKNHLAVGEFKPLGKRHPCTVAYLEYELMVAPPEGKPTRYAKISEWYHPAYLTLRDLRSFFPQSTVSPHGPTSWSWYQGLARRKNVTASVELLFDVPQIGPNAE